MHLLPPHTTLLFLFAVCWSLFWAHRATRSRAILVILIGVGAVHVMLARQGFYQRPHAVPPPQLALLGPVLLATLAMFAMGRARRWLQALPLLPLTMLHIARVPVEVTLHEAYRAGLVPQDMTWSGHNFDILSGISAAFLAAWMLGRRRPGRGVLIGWNLVCLGLLLNVVTTAVLSIPSSVQRLHFDHPNVLVTSAPYILLPALVVPLVFWAHLAALAGLLRKHQR